MGGTGWEVQMEMIEKRVLYEQCFDESVLLILHIKKGYFIKSYILFKLF